MTQVIAKLCRQVIGIVDLSLVTEWPQLVDDVGHGRNQRLSVDQVTLGSLENTAMYLYLFNVFGTFVLMDILASDMDLRK